MLIKTFSNHPMKAARLRRARARQVVFDVVGELVQDGDVPAEAVVVLGQAIEAYGRAEASLALTEVQEKTRT